MQNFVETWQGEAVNWECDELGHLNMRHYITKVQQARQMFIMMLGLDDAFRRGSASTARATRFHIRYLKEARPGDPLRIETGLMAINDTQINLVHILYHADDSVAATVNEWVAHIYMPTQEPFAWPARVQTAAHDYKTTLPDIAKPRGLDIDEPMDGADLDRIKSWGSDRVGMGVFTPREIDSFKYVSMQHILGRVSDSIGNFQTGWPERAADPAKSSNTMGVLLEARLARHTMAEAGMPYHFYSGVRSFNDNVREFIHHLINPLTGQSYASMIGIGAMLDLHDRRLVKASPQTLDALQKAQLPDLRP